MVNLNELYSAFAGQSDVPMEARGVYIEAQLAKLIAYRLPLPSAPLDGLQQYYAGNHAPLARQMVSAFNELFPVNVLTTLELVYVIWRFRYYLCHNPHELNMDRFLADAGSNLAPRYQDMVIKSAGPGVFVILDAFLSSKFDT